MNLTELAALPGAADRNFEALTRAIVSRRYGRLGPLRERRNQPGVEFYLRVEHSGVLGDPGRVWGWSCKWFELNAKHELSGGQRKLIEESVEKAVKYVDGLTDFVLCLPERPAKKDEEWIDGLGAAHGITTRLWTTENFEAELGGFDELRSTFFGELVLTPELLARAHERSVAPVTARWVPLLHTANHIEHRIDRVLLRPDTVSWLGERAEDIAIRVASLRAALASIDDDDIRSEAEHVAGDLDSFVGDMRAIVDAAGNLRPSEVRERLGDQQPPATSPRALRRLVLQLRKLRLPAALDVTGLAAEIRDVIQWITETSAAANVPLVALVGAAGHGKTHLAAQLTAPIDRPTAGVFIQGANLRSGGSLDDLARRIPGLKIDRFDDLLEALNSAGSRAGSQIPLIIDGLNEAEKPAEWRGLLAQLTPVLADYPYVNTVVTLREKLAEQVIPDAAAAMQLDWYRSEVSDLVTAYFDYYLINAAGSWLPTSLFENPLFLRMYCEAANHARQEPVGVEALPTSLIGVFERYRQVMVDRLADDPVRMSIPADEIRRRLAALAGEMWTRRVRRLPVDDARRILDAGETNWDESLFRRLEEEGVLFREDVDGSEDSETGFVFDLIAGYFIADVLLVRMRLSEVDERLAEEALWESLLGDEGHPLGEDVAFGLVGLVPRRFAAHHLWRYAPEHHRPWALAQELSAEAEFLDDGTVDELARLVSTPVSESSASRRRGGRGVFDRLWELRNSPAHRLNANFLDRALRQLPLPERDRKWTEWVREHADDLVVADLQQMIERWAATMDRAASDDLDGLAVAWLLTSTNRQVRDLATKALQRYGRPEPKRLFELATRMLDVDDLYVVERVVGAAFGAATAHQMPDPGGSFEHAFGRWLGELRDRFLEGGSSPTSYELLRGYVRASFELAGTLHPNVVPDGVNPLAVVLAAVPPAPVMADDDPNAAECDRTFGMDFENYVIGSAVEGRANYDSEHPEFRRARGEVMARVWELGWRAAVLGSVDDAIARYSSRSSRYSGNRAKVERYGKKYGWIAYYELIGRRDDAGLVRERWWGGGRNVSADIDPTFPDEPPPAPVHLPKWAPGSPTDDAEWLRGGTVNVPDEVWAPDVLHSVAGEWLLVEGYLTHDGGGRTVFGFFRTFLLESDDVESAVTLAGAIDYPGNDFFSALPTVRGVFAGEMPWSPRFEVRYGNGTEVDDDQYNLHPRPSIGADWQKEGIKAGQVAVTLEAPEGKSPAGLKGSYDVPSFEFAARFGLRQLPGTLDLVGLDGMRASVAFRGAEPWRGHLLYIRRDLLVQFAGHHKIVQIAWGERQVAVEWSSPPAWARATYETYGHVWRHIRVLNDN
ncbi:NACHT domain-containing protein [Cryptosporangium minutisporangium]|uniref:ATP-binding protein n=1 Tax=Cryptosporangium minutisporangium TaxID=113569 RepID=A0ABP6TEU0_9ACTN